MQCVCMDPHTNRLTLPVFCDHVNSSAENLHFSKHAFTQKQLLRWDVLMHINTRIVIVQLALIIVLVLCK